MAKPKKPKSEQPPSTPSQGHNSIAVDELRALIERIERLEGEKKDVGDDIKDVYAEAKARGYSPKQMKSCVRLRKMEPNIREEEEALLDTYKAALGLSFGDTPLGRAAGIADGAQLSVSALADRLREFGATVEHRDGIGTVFILPAGAGAEVNRGGEGEGDIPLKVRDPSDGSVKDQTGLATIDE